MKTRAKVGYAALGAAAVCFAPVFFGAIGIWGGVQWQLATIRATVSYLRNP